MKQILSVLVVSFMYLSAQGQTFQWAKKFTGPNENICEDIARDAKGNLYTTGYFLGIVDFDPGVGISNLSSGSDACGFVTKLDSNGQFIWAKEFNVGSGGTNGPTVCRSIELDKQGNIYLAGHFKGVKDFDSTRRSL